LPKQQGEPWGVCVRISYAKDGSTLGVERQEPPCRELVERMGGQVAKVYVRNDITGFDPRKFPFPDALADLRAGVIRGICAWQADRFTRRTRHALDILDAIEESGARLATVSGQYDLTTAAGRFNWRQMANMAEFESDLKGERLRSKFDQLAAAGAVKGGAIRAFGFKRDGKTHDKREAKLINEAADRILAGESTAAITRDWHERGIRTPATKRHPQGNPWTATKLHRMLTSPRVAGLRQHRGVVLEGVRAAWEPILERGKWERLRSVLRDPGRSQPGPQRRYELSSILRCGGCKQPMHTNRDGRGHNRYVCRQSGGNYTGPGCGKISVSQPALDAYVEKRLFDWLCGPGLQQARAQLASQEAEAERIRAEQREDDALLDQYSDWLADGTWDAPRYRRQQERYNRRTEARNRKLAAMPKLRAVEGLPEVREELERVWPRLPMERRRAILKSVIKVLRVYSGKPGARFSSRRVVLAFIDRQQAPDGSQTAIVPVVVEDAELLGKIRREGPPQHETDPTVLDQVARSMEGTREEPGA
jgi:site-specific DNA recombinase